MPSSKSFSLLVSLVHPPKPAGTRASLRLHHGVGSLLPPSHHAGSRLAAALITVPAQPWAPSCPSLGRGAARACPAIPLHALPGVVCQPGCKMSIKKQILVVSIIFFFFPSHSFKPKCLHLHKRFWHGAPPKSNQIRVFETQFLLSETAILCGLSYIFSGPYLIPSCP